MGAAACGGGHDGTSPGGGGLPTSPKTDWTVFVYGHGDHNLGPSLV
jgi:hypothetical protein